MDLQITVDELVESYQNEISVLMHNKIMHTLQIEKMNKYIKILEENIEKLNNELKQLKE